MAKTYFMLFDVLNDYSFEPFKGKYQFGDLEHAKKAAQKDSYAGAAKSTRPKSAYRIKWTRAVASGTRPDAIMEWNGSIHDGELTYKIIERSKNPVARKKRRSAKQIAATKKLVALNKKRRKKKTRRKVAKRKTNPKRKTAAKSHLQLVFKCRGNNVSFLLLGPDFSPRWSSDKGNAIRFKTKRWAQGVANQVAKKRGMSNFQVGVCNASTTAASIRAACSK